MSCQHKPASILHMFFIKRSKCRKCGTEIYLKSDESEKLNIFLVIYSVIWCGILGVLNSRLGQSLFPNSIIGRVLFFAFVYLLLYFAGFSFYVLVFSRVSRKY